jgi:hypothetical protein
MEPIKLTYKYHDKGLGRHYYANGRTRYCLKTDWDLVERMYLCSKDGEPEYEINNWEII